MDGLFLKAAQAITLALRSDSGDVRGLLFAGNAWHTVVFNAETFPCIIAPLLAKRALFARDGAAACTPGRTLGRCERSECVRLPRFFRGRWG